MNRLLLMLALLLGIQAKSQITNRLIVTQNFEQGINAPNLMFTVPPNDNRIYVASRDSLKLNFPQIRKIKDSIAAFCDLRYKAIGYAPDWSEITGKPTTLAGYGITDAYPLSGNPSNFVNQAGARSSISAGTGISYNSSTGEVTNSAPDQTVVLTGSNGITTSGTYPNLTIAKTKRQETYSGTTNASGTYTVTYGTAYGATPNVQFNIGTGSNNKETILLTASSTTGFTVYVQLRADVLGLLPSYSNVSGRNVDVLVTEK